MSSSQAAGGSTWKCRRTLGPGSCWVSLPEDLIHMVASRLLDCDFLDYVRFRAVCTSWRSSTISPSGRGVTDPRFHPRRWMLLPEGHYLYPGHPNLHGYVHFLNLDTGTLVCVQILLLGDHCAIDSVDGLLLLLRNSDQEGTVCLLHPFTGDITELPPLGTLLPQPQVDSWLPNGPTLHRIRRLVRFVCASVSFKAGAMTIMLALHDVARVAYATSQDRRWTLSSWQCPLIYSPLSFQGKLYIFCEVYTPRLDEMHQVFQIDPPEQDGAGADPQLQPPKLIATIPTGKFIQPDGLVQCGTEILVLGHNDLLVSQILVCKLADLVLERFIPVDNIGGNTLCLGERNLSVSSKILPTVKGDNVVYKRSRQPYLAQYHLSSGSLTPAIDNCSLYGRAPGPSSLIHYIFSCCTRDLWYEPRTTIQKSKGC
ncbi:unnamed protein product [Miscanthus lutarioriparius]|uniref:F-box domain-containing protein n=1 Tax=Miscanthus lutarioriparius TaxID=422564 RepID=A0A811REU6_9POAL|nr:unnamed protein product [Miscanthus lutarioriparius]